MANKKIIILLLTLLAYSTQAQFKIGSTTTSASPTSIMELESNNRGFLPPRIFLNNNLMLLNGNKPLDGTIVFNTNFADTMGGLCSWHNGKWNKVIEANRAGSLTNFIQVDNDNQQILQGGRNNDLNFASVIRYQLQPGMTTMFGTNANEISIPTSGLYCISALVTSYNSDLSSTGPVSERYLSIMKNNVQVAANGFFKEGIVASNISAMVYCNQNDKLKLSYFVSVDGYEVYYVRCFVSQIPSVAF